VSVSSDKLAFIGRSRRIFPIDSLLLLRLPVGQRIECLRDRSGFAFYRRGNRRGDRLGFFTLKAAAVNRKTPVGDWDAHLVQPPVDHTERMPHLCGSLHIRPDGAKLRHQRGRFLAGKCGNGRWCVFVCQTRPLHITGQNGLFGQSVFRMVDLDTQNPGFPQRTPRFPFAPICPRLSQPLR